MLKRISDKATDGYTVHEIDGKHVRVTRVQNTDPYYAENQQLRNNIGKDAVRRWAMPIAQIPFADYQELVKRNPGLRKGDAQSTTAEWLKLLRTGAAEQFRTVRRNLVPDSMRPDLGSIILPSRVQKAILGEQNARQTVQE
jgi:hypothetical protein